jgi:hypothetical protein
MITATALRRLRFRRGITLTEILIISLATLFPIGLLRLRDAARYSRSSYLAQSAGADLEARSLLATFSFNAFTPWYVTSTSGAYHPYVQDTPYYGADWATDTNGPGAYAGPGGLGSLGSSVAIAAGTGSPLTPNSSYPSINGPGLPFAYDPLWRYQTVNGGFTQANGPSPVPTGGYYPFDSDSVDGNSNSLTFEARFGSGVYFIRQGDTLAGGLPSAHGLQRISNFNRPYTTNTITGNAVAVMPASLFVPSIFVSGEDVVWQEPANQQYAVGFPVTNAPPVGAAPSPVVPDLSIYASSNTFQPANDFHYSWLFTGQLTNSSNLGCFDGNIVVCENRPFSINVTTAADGSGTSWYQVTGETVVEAIFGHSANIQPPPGAGVAAGYGTGASRTVLLRWYGSQPDPIVKSGDWIADVTYERNQSTVQTRWWASSTIPNGIANPFNNFEWDNLPAQRCIWYQVQKVLPAIPDPYGMTGGPYRSMVVYVNQPLQSLTPLTAIGSPYVLNAALIMPSVVNVIPTTVYTR